MEQLGYHWTDIHEIWYLHVFKKSVEIIQVSLISDKNNDTLHADQYTNLIISDKNNDTLLADQYTHLIISDKNNDTLHADQIKTHVLCSVTFVDNRAVYEIMWKNTVEPDRPQMTMWYMPITCWITKAKNTHSEYAILFLCHLSDGCTNAPKRYMIRTVQCLSSGTHDKVHRINITALNDNANLLHCLNPAYSNSTVINK
jgi:hypothetical protein